MPPRSPRRASRADPSKPLLAHLFSRSGAVSIPLRKALEGGESSSVGHRHLPNCPPDGLRLPSLRPQGTPLPDAENAHMSHQQEDGPPPPRVRGAPSAT